MVSMTTVLVLAPLVSIAVGEPQRPWSFAAIAPVAGDAERQPDRKPAMQRSDDRKRMTQEQPVNTDDQAGTRHDDAPADETVIVRTRRRSGPEDRVVPRKIAVSRDHVGKKKVVVRHDHGLRFGWRDRYGANRMVIIKRNGEGRRTVIKKKVFSN